LSVRTLANGQCKAKPANAICLTALSHSYGISLSHSILLHEHLSS